MLPQDYSLGQINGLTLPPDVDLFTGILWHIGSTLNFSPLLTGQKKRLKKTLYFTRIHSDPIAVLNNSIQNIIAIWPSAISKSIF